MIKEILAYTGLKKNFIFFKKIDFYIFILIAQLFYLFLALLTKRNIYFFDKNLNKLLFLLISQAYTAFFEEFIFRGFIQTYLKNLLKNALKSIILTSIIFSFFHIFKHNLIWAIGVFFPSLIFGYLREKYSLWAAIFLHLLYNLEYFLLFS